MKRRTYESGDVIFREGEPSDAAYLIVSGRVEIVKGQSLGRPRTIAVLGAAEYVGEMGAIDDRPRSASAVAQGPVVCMSVTQDEFMDMLLSDPEESIDLLKILFQRLRVTSNKLAGLDRAEE